MVEGRSNIYTWLAGSRQFWLLVGLALYGRREVAARLLWDLENVGCQRLDFGPWTNRSIKGFRNWEVLHLRELMVCFQATQSLDL